MSILKGLNLIETYETMHQSISCYKMHHFHKTDRKDIVLFKRYRHITLRIWKEVSFYQIFNFKSHLETIKTYEFDEKSFKGFTWLHG